MEEQLGLRLEITTLQVLELLLTLFAIIAMAKCCQYAMQDNWWLGPFLVGFIGVAWAFGVAGTGFKMHRIAYIQIKMEQAANQRGYETIKTEHPTTPLVMPVLAIGGMLPIVALFLFSLLLATQTKTPDWFGQYYWLKLHVWLVGSLFAAGLVLILTASPLARR